MPALAEDPTRRTWRSGSGVGTTWRACAAPCEPRCPAWRPIDSLSRHWRAQRQRPGRRPVEGDSCRSERHQLHPGRCRTAVPAATDAGARPARQRHVAHTNPHVSDPLGIRAPDNRQRARKTHQADLGMTNFRNWRIRVMLYAGKPDWSKLATVTP